jgi:predicted nucleic-acid-binding protein
VVGRPLRITADTNVLLRAIVRDDVAQSRLAERVLAEAESVVIPLPVLCELAWVLRSRYRHNAGSIAATLRSLIASDTVITDEPAARAGLAILESGGDFADGVIAHLGGSGGADTFVTFDVNASKLLDEQGYKSLLLE